METETHIQPVILAGGPGNRLWPISRQDRPKQLLALTSRLSLLQETALRLEGLRGIRVASQPLVMTNREYRLAVAGQLGEVGIAHPHIVSEPLGRNTAPAVTLACLALAREGYDPLLFVMPSDHFIADKAALHKAIAEGAALANEGMLVLFGVAPTHPDTGYGYIGVGDELAGARSARALEEFAEKPDARMARIYVETGHHLWNSGMFMMRRSVWLRAIELFRPDLLGACRRSLDTARVTDELVVLNEDDFAHCPAESIDCAVFERLTPRAQAEARLQAAVVPLACGWSDVGGWSSLAAILARDEFGNSARGDAILRDTRGTLVHAESRLVTAYGVDDLVIVDTPDALLVAHKERTRDLGPLLDDVRTANERLIDRYPRQDRPWGRFESIAAGPGFQVKRLIVEPGAKLSLQFHRHRNEHWVVTRGLAEIVCGESRLRLQKDESTFIPMGTPHRLANPGSEPLEIIEVQSGDYLDEDDVVRLQDDYGRTEEI